MAASWKDFSLVDAIEAKNATHEDIFTNLKEVLVKAISISYLK